MTLVARSGQPCGPGVFYTGRPRIWTSVSLGKPNNRGIVPAAGLWLLPTVWNVLEFKGPTVSPREGNLALLIELGLGIARRLNGERVRQGRSSLGPADTAFWYLANRLGRRLLHAWQRWVPGLRPEGRGVWRGKVLGHPVVLVSGSDLPVEEASLPLHLVGRERAETELAGARLVVGRPELWERYGGWLASLHPAAYAEVEGMARQTRGQFRVDLTPIINTMGIDWLIEQVGAERLVQQLGAKRVVDELGGVKKLLAELSPEQRRELKQLLRE